MCWYFEQTANQMPALNILLMELHVIHKLLRITYAEEMPWLLEQLEEQREYLAVQAAYALRKPDLPEPDDED